MRNPDREFERDVAVSEQQREALAHAASQSMCQEAVEVRKLGKLGEHGNPDAIDPVLRWDSRGIKARHLAQLALNNEVN